jgi:voltage-gated potassium channel
MHGTAREAEVERAGTPSRRKRLHEIIFEADTRMGRAFDVGLLIAIVASIVAVMLESVNTIKPQTRELLRIAEWFFTLLFTVEYIMRLSVVERPLRYARSFFGVVDLVAILPTYLSLVFPGAQSLLVVRALRLLRIFRVFKLGRFLGEQNLLLISLRRSRPKVLVFLATVLILDLILGSAMYLIEGEEAGFTSIPRSMYWAIVTMTTVGYGDIAPLTPWGQVLAAGLMILGYSIIAVPTGVVTAEIFEAARLPITTRNCPHCTSEGHQESARYCRDCGELLEP